VEAAVTTGAVSEVVAQVEAQLGAFWAATADEGGGVKARASTMNFVAVSATAEVPHMREGIENLAETRAGRVFLTSVDGRLAPWDVEPDVSAVCHKEGDIVVCYDRIELHFGAMAAARAPSMLAALALGEVPTIVEVGKGAQATLVDALVRTADRVIVDSAHTPVARVADIAHKTTAPIADRAFVRAFSWRDLTASFFDEARGAERAIGRVEIARTPTDRADPAALLIGWLASRLGWRFEAADRAVDAEGMPVEILVKRAREGDIMPGEIEAIRVVAAIDGRPLFCACERKGGERAVRWTLSGARRSVREHALGFHDEGWVLRKAIDDTAADRAYREAAIAGAAWASKAGEEAR
jgi:glucose-6-phosphate dehydrogenase assembly protein OpcA